MKFVNIVAGFTVYFILF